MKSNVFSSVLPHICLIEKGGGVEELRVPGPRLPQVVDVDGGEGGVPGVGVDLEVGGGRGGREGGPGGRLRVPRGGDDPQPRRGLAHRRL